jgi:hypothetical protein
MNLVSTCGEYPYQDTLGVASPRGYADTEVDLQVGGMFHRLYLSETVAGECARLFGWCSPDDAKTLRDQLERAKEEAYAAGFQAAIDKLREMSQTLVAT